MVLQIPRCKHLSAFQGDSDFISPEVLLDAPAAVRSRSPRVLVWIPTAVPRMVCTAPSHCLILAQTVLALPGQVLTKQKVLNIKGQLPFFFPLFPEFSLFY
jgi:hypothetical protein